MSLRFIHLKTSNYILLEYSCSFQFESCGLVTISLYVNNKQEDPRRRCSGARNTKYMMLCAFAKSLYCNANILQQRCQVIFPHAYCDKLQYTCACTLDLCPLYISVFSSMLEDLFLQLKKQRKNVYLHPFSAKFKRKNRLFDSRMNKRLLKGMFFN